MSLQNQTDTERVSEKAALQWLWNVCAGYRWGVVLLAVIAAALGIISVAFAWLLRGLINAAVSADQGLLVYFAALLVGVTLARLALGFANRFLKEHSKSSLENVVKQRVLQALLSAPGQNFAKHHSAAWLNRLTSDTALIANGIVDIIPEVTGMVVRIVGALALLIVLVPQLSVILVVAGLVILGFSALFRGIMSRMHKRIQGADDSLRTLLTDRLENMPLVYAYSKEDQTLQDAQQHMQDHKRARMQRNRMSNLANLGFSAAANGAYIIGAIWCAYGIMQGTVDYGTFVAVIQLIAQIQSPLASITGYVPRTSAVTASAQRCMEALGEQDVEPALSEQDAAKLYDEQLESIRFKDVSFIYPDEEGEIRRHSLKNIDFSFEKGALVVFLGPSGIGKTTALRLLLGMYRPSSGRILLETVDGQLQIGPQHRSLFAYVPQGNQLMSGTIQEAITFNASEQQIDQDLLQLAIEVACAQFVDDLPQGLRTVLGQDGQGLSEGQLQRIAIARAVYSKRRILLLDEATSALDLQTEQRVLQNIQALKDRTVVAVSHRLAALDYATNVVTFSEDR